MWLLVMMAGLTDAPPVGRRWLRPMLIAGPVVFLVVGLGGLVVAASAVLSALVVKGSFFVVVRLWFDVMPGLPGPAGMELLALDHVC
jgi:hypothetical protein